MANALNRALGIDVDSFTAERVREDAFGRDPLVSILVVEMNGRPAGYAFYHSGYDSDLPARSLVVVDLYVDAEARGRGLGQALMAGLAREALRMGARSMTGGVLDSNAKALAFYAGLGENFLRPRFRVGFTDGLGNVDNTLVTVDLNRIAMFAGATVEVTYAMDLSAQAYGVREDGVTFRVGGGYRLTR